MHPKKTDNVIKLSNADRYDYSVREIVKLGKIWAISTPEAWATFVDKSGDEIFPIWPHREVAEICLLEEFKNIQDFSIEPIDYDKFKAFCIPDMIGDGILFGIFYNDQREAIAVAGEELLQDLEDEENGDR